MKSKSESVSDSGAPICGAEVCVCEGYQISRAEMGESALIILAQGQRRLLWDYVAQQNPSLEAGK